MVADLFEQIHFSSFAKQLLFGSGTNPGNDVVENETMNIDNTSNGLTLNNQFGLYEDGGYNQAPIWFPPEPANDHQMYFQYGGCQEQAIETSHDNSSHDHTSFPLKQIKQEPQQEQDAIIYHQPAFNTFGSLSSSMSSQSSNCSMASRSPSNVF